MPLQPTKVTVWFPDGNKRTFDTKQLLVLSTDPYPGVVVRESNGIVKRYMGFPLEITDEETTIIAPAGALG